MILTAQLKTVLTLLGITDLSIRFDVDQHRIVAKYDLKGKGHIKMIPFADLESTFEDLSSPPKATETPPDQRVAFDLKKSG